MYGLVAYPKHHKQFEVKIAMRFVGLERVHDDREGQMCGVTEYSRSYCNFSRRLKQDQILNRDLRIEGIMRKLQKALLLDLEAYEGHADTVEDVQFCTSR
ncbi:putative sucrose-phosphate synthase 3 [Sesbania bispinosa]|nr:putative sucrose-phosphate synthase 3 [Sesbania bispinosa]